MDFFCMVMILTKIRWTRDAESRLFGNARLEGNDAVKAIATELAREQKKPEGADAPAAPAGAAPAATPGRAQP